MSGTVLVNLLNKHLWEETISEFEQKNSRKKAKIDEFKKILDSGEYLEIVNDVLAKRYEFSAPVQHKINKKDTSKKKTVYVFPLKDELLLKVINKILSSSLSTAVSALCHSFQKRKSSKTAFRSLMTDESLDNKFCFKLDIQDYFNSINIDIFLDALPSSIKNDEPLFNLLKHLLSNPSVIINHTKTELKQKGVMAGTPLAPFLSNMFLKSLDDFFKNNGITYARYSDDIILFMRKDEVSTYKDYVYNYLSKNQLTVNNSKTKLAEPGRPWEYLGFKYENGCIDLSDISIKKLKHKVTRLAKYLNHLRVKYQFSIEKTAGILLKYLNRKLYGRLRGKNDFCWAQWFFPLINSPESLKSLDTFIQEKIRFAVTGRYSKRNYKVMPYDKMKCLGYLPLTTAFFTYRNNINQYFKLIAKRTLIEHVKPDNLCHDSQIKCPSEY